LWHFSIELLVFQVLLKFEASQKKMETTAPYCFAQMHYFRFLTAAARQTVVFVYLLRRSVISKKCSVAVMFTSRVSRTLWYNTLHQ
jgi:hypothetical protein